MQAASQASGRHVYVVRSFGRAKSFRRMTCGVLERVLPNLSSCILALAEDDPQRPLYEEELGPWRDRVVWGVTGAEKQVAFIDQIAEKGQRVMVLDDNILKFRDRGDEVTEDLDAIVSLGFSEMQRHSARIWSAADAAKPDQWSEEVDVGNGLIYGAAFGMVATHEAARYSRFGQILDDIERSCRFQRLDGRTVRLGRFQIYKKHVPGSYRASKGGISAGYSSAQDFEEERTVARQALFQCFPDLIEPAETKLGLKFTQEAGKKRAASFIL